MTGVAWSVVVPTLGRAGLGDLLASVRAQRHQPAEVVLVDDRRSPDAPLEVSDRPAVTVLHGGGRGPAAARNRGWRRTGTEWVVVLDDDVLLPPDWSDLLLADLAAAPERTGAVTGRIVVPLPSGRRPTDWERNTSGLERAWWATADMALRRSALAGVGGFDERFPRAYREDADLAARLVAAGWQLRQGQRRIIHPVRPAGFWISVHAQRGNADDALMRSVHGPAWRAVTRCPPGRLRWHLATTAAGTAGLLALAGRRPGTAGAMLAGWAALSADFARRRIAPGPRDRAELARMAVTSALIPPAACWWRLVGTRRHRGAGPWPGTIRAVLFDRDGTLVHDVPYNADPDRVVPVDGAAEALARLRAAGVRIGLVSNQSGVARGLLTTTQVDAVNDRSEELLGRFDSRQVCPHAEADGCSCRKPRPGTLLAAARQLRVEPHECVVVGDIGSDVQAARAAGMWSVLVPTAATLPVEVADADLVSGDLMQAVDLVLSGDVARTARARGAEVVR